MEIINEAELHKFARRHSDARKALANWIDIAKAAGWVTFADLRKTFRSADYVKHQVIFDIRGNKYRLITSVDYAAQRIYILEVMTHADYSKWSS